MSVLYGNCNFRNLEFNTVCGCQEFTPEEDEDVAVGTTGLLSAGGRARKTCLCGHFVNFHSKRIDAPREHASKQRHVVSDSFRSARLRSGATSPTSIALTSNKQQTPTTEPGQDYGDTYTLSKTFEDPPARYQANPHNRILAGSYSDAAGLGISLRTTGDAGGSYAGRSGDSSAITEIAPHLANGRMHGRPVQQPLLSDTRRGQRGGTLLRSARSSPLLGHQQMQQLNLNSDKAADDTTPIASTVADSQVITGQDRYLEFDRRVNGALHIVRGLSQAFLPLSLQEGIRLHTPNAASRDNAPFIAFDERDANDELKRQTLAIETQLRTLARTVAGRLNGGVVDDEPRGRIEELPQSVPNDGPLRLQALKSSPLKPPVDVVETAQREVSPRPVSPTPAEENDEVALTSSVLMPPAAGVSESFVNKRIHEIVEKVDLQEEICNDVMKFKNDKEEEIEELGANVFSLEERLSNMENQFHRFLEDREQSFRKRLHEEEEDDAAERKKRSKRHRREIAVSDLRTPSLVMDKRDKSHKKAARGSEQLLDATFKQTLTTTTSFTRTHSTATSFTSASSSSTSTPLNQPALIKALSSKIGVLQQRLQQIEAVATPSCERPWIVQVVVLPQTIWTTWRGTKDGDLIEQQRVPRALQSSSRAWKRLHSRGLIKCLEVTGGEARDVERAIRKAFGGVFSALSEVGDASAKDDGPHEWSPLRKASEQTTLRALSPGEMSKQFWKVDFLRGTCAEDLRSLTPSHSRSSPLQLYDPSKGSQIARSGASPTKSQASGQKPTHRLYITNCWTEGMGGSWDLTRENTQLSSANSKRHVGSAFSTQPSSLGAQSLRRRLRVDGGSNSSGSPKVGADHPYRSGWSDIRNLPPETVYIYDNKHQISSMKPRPAEDEAFWYYDPSLDGPRDDNHSSGSSNSSGDGTTIVSDIRVTVPTLAVTTNDEEISRSQRSPSYNQRKDDSQHSPKLATQQSCTLQETAATSQVPQQQPLLVSQASFSGRLEPSLKNSFKNLGDSEFASASLGLHSHDSDSTPKASFLGTHSSFANSAAVAAAKPLRRSRRNREAKASQQAANSLLDPLRSAMSQPMSRQDSRGSGTERWEDAPLRLSRASTLERDA
ncbi:hypothetical protein TWF696_000849 [Orbilia brochopaga]|uniref:Uncharacterized protein n=1 Tax=Orbilia brochopaga TaxID=3140254 RepID=A0AAV9VG27_9PEZI